TIMYPCMSFTSLYYELICIFLFPIFFFSIIPHPPRSTLFPTRRSSDLGLARARYVHSESARPCAGHRRARRRRPPDRTRRCRCRSEEHTSELQSPYDLVCRLLLEKKKKFIGVRPSI